MAVVEHEETRAKTELGAAQKDTARELSAKLASLKGHRVGRRRHVLVRPGLHDLSAAEAHHR